ncbi:Fis family transcriptional regulator [Bacillus velezensis]|uniref:Fis family transcriptional regulator n=1 Tax=Bacillus velezensis TaxID=492670 RepID=UPI002DBA2B7E|nr:Fis family transcriptional regulator [Bacillus velezensis]MEC1510606.1 Fis family transcriptional regulator [Bacillus velezensis]
MISDIELTLEWLQNGRQPGARRGADRRDAYQKTILPNPRLIDALPKEYAIIQEGEGEVSDWDKEIFLMHVVQNMSNDMKYLNKSYVDKVFEYVFSVS